MRKILCLYLATFILLINANVLAIADDTSPDDNIKVTINGVNVHFPDQQPVILNGRTYIPVRFIVENLGAHVEWSEEARSVLTTREDVSLSLSIDSENLIKSEYADGAEEIITMDVSPLIINDRTMLPIRFVAEALDCSVDWDDETRTVVISESEVNSVNDEETVSSAGMFDYVPEKNPDVQPEITPSPAPTEAPEIVIDVSEYEQEVLRLVNEERSKENLSPLTWDERLASAARKHSIDMAERKYFSHQSTVGLGPIDRMRDEGANYYYLKENIAEGIRTPEAVVEAWMNSPTCKIYILSKDYTHMGVGFHYMENDADGYYYWTQCFGGDYKRGPGWGGGYVHG